MISEFTVKIQQVIAPSLLTSPVIPSVTVFNNSQKSCQLSHPHLKFLELDGFLRLLGTSHWVRVPLWGRANVLLPGRDLRTTEAKGCVHRGTVGTQDNTARGDPWTLLCSQQFTGNKACFGSAPISTTMVSHSENAPHPELPPNWTTTLNNKPAYTETMRKKNWHHLVKSGPQSKVWIQVT